VHSINLDPLAPPSRGPETPLQLGPSGPQHHFRSLTAPYHDELLVLFRGEQMFVFFEALLEVNRIISASLAQFIEAVLTGWERLHCDRNAFLREGHTTAVLPHPTYHGDSNILCLHCSPISPIIERLVHVVEPEGVQGYDVHTSLDSDFDETRSPLQPSKLIIVAGSVVASLAATSWANSRSETLFQNAPHRLGRAVGARVPIDFTKKGSHCTEGATQRTGFIVPPPQKIVSKPFSWKFCSALAITLNMPQQRSPCGCIAITYCLEGSRGLCWASKYRGRFEQLYATKLRTVLFHKSILRNIPS